MRVLKLINNMYGQKQVGRVWNRYLTDKLLTICLIKSAIDKCGFLQGHTIFVSYVDDGIFYGPCKEEIHQYIKDVESSGLEIEDKWYID